jgi:hypothetical protein
MDLDVLAKLVVDKGYGNVNLSMFSEEDQRKILEKAAEHFTRLGRLRELIALTEKLDPAKYRGIMEKYAQNLLELGQYKDAAFVYERLGQKELAETIRMNF